MCLLDIISKYDFKPNHYPIHHVEGEYAQQPTHVDEANAMPPLILKTIKTPHTCVMNLVNATY